MSWLRGKIFAASVVMAATACSRTEGQAAPSDAEAEAVDPPGASDAASGEAPPSPSEDSDPSVASAKPPPPPPPPKPEDAGTCPDKDDSEYGILVTPKRPVSGAPFEVVAATFVDETPLALRLETKDGDPVEAEVEFRAGVPSATILRVAAGAVSGKLRAVVGRGGKGKRCRTFQVGKGKAGRRPRSASTDHVWPVSRGWTGGEEALFSAWVRALFSAARGEDLAWKRLDQATSDPSRNLLHDHYGWGEDVPNKKDGLYLKPDCADTPYFLRAYYSWKRELPFGFRRCSRGKGKAPHCGKLRGVASPPEDAPDASKPGELGSVQKYFRRTLAWGVHTGNGRTAFGDDETDFYPYELSRRNLRPGSIYADPYGHIFVVVELMAGSGNTPGILYAIDGQPDGSITRKRFWEGNFLWNPDPVLGGAGFKAFRPLDLKRADDGRAMVPATDADILSRAGYGDAGDEQSKLEAHAFYDKMDALITPGKRDPFIAQEEAVRALYEAAKVRVTSVQNGEEHKAKGGGVVAMPDGYSIFETTGAWENFSTPARDLRLLIAIDLVRGFADKVARNETVFVNKSGSMAKLRTELDARLQSLLADPSLKFEYRRSDGSTWPMTVADVIDRAEAFEMAYNPNDCPELRWGAPKGSDERRTCRDRAPEAQRRKMSAYRPWFSERRRPARGDPGPPVH